MADEAKKLGLFLMEALWPPFQPSYLKASAILEQRKNGQADTYERQVCLSVAL